MNQHVARSTDDEPVTVGERYCRASTSSHLRVTAGSDDVDLLIAAGWAPDWLGALLYRLCVEFDAVRSELRGDKPLSLTDRLLVLVRVRSLRPVKARLFAFALLQATKRRFMRSDDVVRSLVGRSIDVFLDPLCGHCDGRGTHGGYGVPAVICNRCQGSGTRATRVGDADDERLFAAYLLAEMERRMAGVEGEIRRRLRRA